MPKHYDVIAALAFIHLFDKKEAKKILVKMYHDLAKNGIINLTTTKEDHYEYGKIVKADYGNTYVRYRAKHTPQSFVSLLD